MLLKTVIAICLLAIVALAAIIVFQGNPEMQKPVKIEEYTLTKNIPVKLTGNYDSSTNITLADIYQNRVRLNFPNGTADIGPETIFYQENLGNKQYIRISLEKIISGTSVAIKVRYYNK